MTWEKAATRSYCSEPRRAALLWWVEAPSPRRPFHTRDASVRRFVTVTRRVTHVQPCQRLSDRGRKESAFLVLGTPNINRENTLVSAACVVGEATQGKATHSTAPHITSGVLVTSQGAICPGLSPPRLSLLNSHSAKNHTWQRSLFSLVILFVWWFDSSLICNSQKPWYSGLAFILHTLRAIHWKSEMSSLLQNYSTLLIQSAAQIFTRKDFVQQLEHSQILGNLMIGDSCR